MRESQENRQENRQENGTGNGRKIEPEDGIGMDTGEPPMSTSSLDKIALEEGTAFTPRFDADGLIACITTDARDGQVLMLAYMNAEALRLTLETGTVHYWSRSRRALWRKGETSGQIQTVQSISTDCDQDALLVAVVPGGDGGACHTGRRSCFYRKLVRDGAKVTLSLDSGAETIA
jgi:phosphoribosyl-AMP cyclohydrolase